MWIFNFREGEVCGWLSCLVECVEPLNCSPVDVRRERRPTLPFFPPLLGPFSVIPLLCLCPGQSSLPIQEVTGTTKLYFFFFYHLFLSPYCFKILRARFAMLFAHYFWCILCLDTCLLFIKQTHQTGSTVCLSSEAHLARKQWSAPFYFLHMLLKAGRELICVDAFLLNLLKYTQFVRVNFPWKIVCI